MAACALRALVSRLKLPEVTVRKQVVPSTKEERRAYDSVLRKAKVHMDNLRRSGMKQTIRYRHVFVWLLRLRQIASDMRLLLMAGKEAAATATDDTINDESQAGSLDSDHEEEANAKEEEMDEEERYMEAKDEELEDERVIASLRDHGLQPLSNMMAILGSKTQAILNHLIHLRHTKPDEKIILFSQWRRFLDLLEPELRRANIPFVRYDGQVKGKRRRQTVLQSFREQDGPPLLLMTTGAGDRGLNLQCANNLVFSDLMYNPAVGSQAIARCDRIGQVRLLFGFVMGLR